MARACASGANPRRRIGASSSRAAFVVVAAWLLACSAGAARADCNEPLAQLVVVKGRVELLRDGGVVPTSAAANAPLCAGDSVVVHAASQAALLLSNATVVRLDAGTTATLSPASADRPALLNVVSGAAYVISRTPRPFRVRTPFINANVEGTEFLVEARRDRGDDGSNCARQWIGAPAGAAETDRITVFEGHVQATDASATTALTLRAGETAVATATGGLTRAIVVRPRDAVTWTLHVPPVFDAAHAPLPPRVTCAQRLLAQGRLDDAKRLLGGAVPSGTGPGDSAAYALRATIAVAQNEKDAAMHDGGRATELDPGSAGAWVARSYAEQASFRIEAALASAIRANAIAPDALRQARLAELQLAVADVDAALAAASAAARADPQLARAHTVAGFVHLVRVETDRARQAFADAIRLDPADPLPRLGLGLARIRAGDLAGGRAEIEVAALLDTDSSLIRSYLGKAYYEEKRDAAAESQLALATERDPKDPTPWFYGAILKESANRPVEALGDLQRSIELNDNRAVYRSRLLLDQDLAARRVSLARTYRMLGFDQLALLEAVKSLSADPGDASAHLFLADSYAGQVRSEAARVGELFQAQLRQPLGLNTISPELLTDRRQFVAADGPVQASTHEFTPLFNRNQVAAKLDALGGSHRTAADQLFVSALRDRVAFSAGQYHYETAGLRENNDLKHDATNAFVQFGPTPGVRLQAEWREDRSKQGDLALRFDRDDFSRNLRDELRRRLVRVGGIAELDAASSLVVSAIAGRSTERLFSKLAPDNAFEDRERVRAVELQYLVKARDFHVTTGISQFTNRVVLADPGGSANSDEKGRSLYALAVFTGLPAGLRPQLGVSFDRFEQAGVAVSRTDPRLGLLWLVAPDTTVRAAWFKTIKRSVIANETVQPSQVFGFNQSFDDPNGTLSRRRGVAIHHRVSGATFVGAETSARDSQVPGFPGDPYADWTERYARAYLYRILDARTALTAELQYERLRRPEENSGNEAFTKVGTLLAPVALRFHAAAWSASLQATYVRQRVQSVSRLGELVDGRGSMLVADAGIAYQLPQRRGTVSLEAKNLFDRRFSYQEIDAFAGARFSPERWLLLRISLAF